MLVVPFMLPHPERRTVLHGVQFRRPPERPAPLAKAGLLVLGAAGLELTAAITIALGYRPGLRSGCTGARDKVSS